MGVAKKVQIILSFLGEDWLIVALIVLCFSAFIFPFLMDLHYL